MFSYRHAFHAGNHADVLKHTVLIATLGHLLEKDAALTVVDGVGRQFRTGDGPEQIAGLDALITANLDVLRTELGTFPRQIFDSAKNELPPQVHVLATMIMLVAVVIIVGATVIANRRAARS